MTSKNLRATRSSTSHSHASASQSGRDWTLLLLDLSIISLIAVALVAATALFWLYSSNRILLSVQSLGVPLQGQSTYDAEAALRTAWERRDVTLVASNRTLTASPGMLGLQLNAEATARDAHAQSRTLAAAERAIFGGDTIDVPPVWTLDPAVSRAYLDGLTPDFYVAPGDAGIHIVNGRAEAIPPAPGRTLDVEATLAWLQQNASRVVAENQMPLIMKDVAPARSDVSGAVDEINQLLANQLSVRAYDPIRDERFTWTVSSEQWGEWIALSLHEDDTGVTWSVKPEAARAFVESQSSSLGDYRRLDAEQAVPAVVDAIQNQQWNVSARVYHTAQPHTVQAGETLSSIGRDYGIPYPWIQAANPDLGDSLSVGQVITIPSPDELVPLPAVENKRIIVSIDQQRMWVYENDALKWEWAVSTGIDSSPTAPGVFQVQFHDPNAYASKWDLWMPNFMGIYQPVPNNDFMNGFHGFPTRSGSTLLWTDDLGHKVTYGCILVSSQNAQALYEWADEGVIVEVRQ